MKSITIRISDYSDAYSAISSLNDQIPETTRDSPDFKIIYPVVTACIEDFADKAKKLAKTGTTIHIQKKFPFPDVSVMVVLEYPRKMRFLEKLSGFLKKR